MALNESVIARVRQLLIRHLPDGVSVDEIREKKMFGGLAFMVREKMCVVISRRQAVDIMARIGAAAQEAWQEHEGVRATVMRGKALRDFIDYDMDMDGGQALEALVILALQYNQILHDAEQQKMQTGKTQRKKTAGP